MATIRSGDAEAEALDRLSVDGIRRLLDHLSPDQRDVLLLRILAGLTIVEVAAVLGKRPGAVKALQARGVRAVQAEISRGAETL
jgi:RNA polymerase sigma factor (sigma-70 family)